VFGRVKTPHHRIVVASVILPADLLLILARRGHLGRVTIPIMITGFSDSFGSQRFTTNSLFTDKEGECISCQGILQIRDPLNGNAVRKHPAKLKRTGVIAGASCALLLLAFLVLGFLRDWSEAARNVQVDDVCQKLAIEVRLFQIQEGHYPSSLSDLQATTHLDEANKQIIRELTGIAQHNKWQDKYNYIPSTNGFFSIVVSGPAAPPMGWFGKTRTIARHYQVGDTLKSL